MTLLVDWQIKSAIEEGALVVSPYDESLVNPSSLDFRLGDKFGKATPTGTVRKKARDLNSSLQFEYMLPLIAENADFSVIDPTDKDSFINEMITADKYILMPKEFIIATTLESFAFNGIKLKVEFNNARSWGIAAKIAGKSSLGRLGLANSSVAGFIDPGFACEGITLELFNYSETAIVLSKGMKIGQLMLAKTEDPIDNYSVTGRYNNQASGEGSKGV